MLSEGLKEVPGEPRRRERLLEEAQRIAHVGYWERDLTTGRITFSDEARRIFGLAPHGGTITIEDVAERLHPEDRVMWSAAVAQTLRDGTRYDLNYRIVRPDGEVRFVHSQGDLTRDAIGQPLSVFGAVQDVTELKRAEQLTQLVFERAPDAICIIGRDYRYRRVNPVFERISGRSAKDLVGMHVADVLGAAVFEQTVKPMHDRCFEGEEVAYAEWFKYPDARRYVSITHSPLRSKSDQVEAILTIFRDLTDHVLASEALRSAQAELAHANRVSTMGQLTASIAHEVNQPIGAIVMNAQAALRWLNAEPPNLERIRQSLDLVVDDGERAGEVVSRIRGLVKKAPPRKEGIDINSAVLDVIALTRSEVLEHGFFLQTDLAADLPLVDGDRVQLQQIVLNLIMNAVDAMSCLAVGEGELRISTSTDASNRVLVSVHDNGPGVDPNIADRLFEAFYTTKPGGMGMGLAICRSIIEAHGGRLWVAANEPRGALFQFSLPAERDGASAESVGQTSAA
ncbi:Adaptive-response sensory-kinase SasA [subsurface metagenome]